MDYADLGSQSVARALDLLRLLGDDGGSLADAARGLGITQSTAYRLAAQLQRAGLLVRVGRGRYAGGLALRRLAARVDPDAVAVAVARPLLAALARRTGRVAHFGVFDDDMVTYLVREGPARADVFTREGIQLEAYCTGIGKVLLAGFVADRREAYLAGGGFVPLTPRTIVDPAALRAHLAHAAAAGFARDDEESKAGLFCVAVPVATADPARAYAISLSGTAVEAGEDKANRAAITATAAALTRRLGGASG